MSTNIYKFVRTDEVKYYFEVEAETEIEAYEKYGLMESGDAQDRRILRSETELLGSEPADEEDDITMPSDPEEADVVTQTNHPEGDG